MDGERVSNFWSCLFLSSGEIAHILIPPAERAKCVKRQNKELVIVRVRKPSACPAASSSKSRRTFLNRDQKTLSIC